MPITPRNVLRHELIGLECAVLKSGNAKQEGISGIIVDETRNTIAIMKNGKAAKIAKAGAEFVFALPDGKKVKVSGQLLVARPENRIRTKLKRW
ncbi:MAG: ribonuclease P protein component 1 [Candidatus Aenigmatarchaeota archaeon]